MMGRGFSGDTRKSSTPVDGLMEAMVVVSFQVQTENLEHSDKTVRTAPTVVVAVSLDQHPTVATPSRVELAETPV